LKSTLADMMKYAAAHLAEKDAAARLSHAPTVTSGDYAVGLNWQMLRAGERRLIWQQGNVPGFLSYCILLPESRLALVVLSNESDEQAPARIQGAANALLKQLDPQAVLLP
jgi:D-alanyl-D-alanine-carboxypeptidase/D-alanyl-D-alanine-endopeptidase